MLQIVKLRCSGLWTPRASQWRGTSLRSCQNHPAHVVEGAKVHTTDAVRAASFLDPQLQRLEAAPFRSEGSTVEPILQYEHPYKGSDCCGIRRSLRLGRSQPSVRASSAAPFRGLHEDCCATDMQPMRMRTPPWTRSPVLKNIVIRNLLKMRRAQAAKPANPGRRSQRDTGERPEHMEAVLGHPRNHRDNIPLRRSSKGAVLMG